MRKIVVGGMVAALALGLTACGGIGDGKTAGVAPSSPVGSTPTSSAPTSSAPTSSSPTHSAPAQGKPSTPGGGTSNSGGSGAPAGLRTPLSRAGNQVIKSKWGRLRYLAPGKFAVGNVVFFIANATTLYVAGGPCPDGSTPPGVSKCNMDGFEGWVQAAPHNANVRFAGQGATVITETQ
ncbi:hypothetical protein E1293_04625 [Actinomadura darangshiensis]|uniref:Uncharacterized protein n=1 Tax=Actinomadura darangshiensis TaxID=705336 RepID=A0A4R5BR91_9ACTN|nr:hypothetical protein [Actinomadura darangshiensis]TDD89498.1 hypothetical protein E1293_04625 [Actinomadura darangshiensis]